MNEIDEELLKVIDEAIANSADYLEAFDKVIDFKKKHRGLKGYHVSPPIDFYLNTRNDIDPKVDPKVEANKIAHDILMMEKARAKGELKEVPMSELEKM